MINEEPSTSNQENENQTTPNAHLIATGLGAVEGGIAGSALSRSIGGKLGAAIGRVSRCDRPWSSS